MPRRGNAEEKKKKKKNQCYFTDSWAAVKTGDSNRQIWVF